MAAEGEVKAENLEPSDLEKKIIRQVEYYFGNINYPRDKFLKEKILEDEGWITIECLTTFNRLKMLSTDLAEIATALKKSSTGLLEINDTDYKVRRSLDKPPPNMDDPLVRKASRSKTLYIKGFPETYTFDNVQDFFLAQGVSTIFIKCKTDEQRNFKGSIFVELTTQEQSDTIMNNKDLACEGNSLTVIARDEYYKNKDAEKKKKDKTADVDSKDNDELKALRKPGSVMHFKTVGENTTREDLKELFGKHSPIAWVDFNKGETEGFVRFKDEGTAQKVIDAIKEANDGKVVINDVESTVRVIEGEEEENYWKMVLEDKKRQQLKRNAGRKKKYRGEKNFKRKRTWENDEKTEKDDKEKENDVKEETKDKEEESEKHTYFGSDDEKKEKRTREKSGDDAVPAKKVKVDE